MQWHLGHVAVLTLRIGGRGGELDRESDSPCCRCQRCSLCSRKSRMLARTAAAAAAAAHGPGADDVGGANDGAPEIVDVTFLTVSAEVV